MTRYMTETLLAIFYTKVALPKDLLEIYGMQSDATLNCNMQLGRT